MEYGTGFLRTTRTTDDDTVSMLSATNQPSPHHAYSPEHSRESSASSIADRSSWAVSPVALQQALPPAPPEQESSGGIGASIFGSRAVLDTPYQETVAFGAARQSRSARPDSPKPEAQATVSAVPESDPPPQSRRYFRHPRHILEPWTSGFWIRFPWLGFGALLGVILLTGVSAGILLASHGTAVEDWRVGDDNAQPQVYISLSEMIMNFLIIFTLMDGMTVRFWRQLIHGSTLSAIYDTYDSVSFWPAFMRMIRLRFNVVTVGKD
ncbi:hypothetical protein K469DRAFT_157361 [Zopfia rhizophila CBS 207.26]|uniref:Uncharacterized protein n=1 Tax=Zopfia rhizophila CBS 207.26 TaxID=1314779 RepID=A0A6A6E1N8_9PEZI|nr:hypothetical protein K469DRAFT_157361 [Zopfia rhizophila CBS 207.26]